MSVTSVANSTTTAFELNRLQTRRIQLQQQLSLYLPVTTREHVQREYNTVEHEIQLLQHQLATGAMQNNSRQSEAKTALVSERPVPSVTDYWSTMSVARMAEMVPANPTLPEATPLPVGKLRCSYCRCIRSAESIAVETGKCKVCEASVPVVPIYTCRVCGHERARGDAIQPPRGSCICGY
jgi:hypothetical protein